MMRAGTSVPTLRSPHIAGISCAPAVTGRRFQVPQPSP